MAHQPGVMVSNHGRWLSHHGGLLACDRHAVNLGVSVRVVRKRVRDVPHHRRLRDGHRLWVNCGEMGHRMHGDVSDRLAATRGRNVRQMFRPSLDDVVDSLDDGRMGYRGMGDDCWLMRGNDVGRGRRGDGLRGDHCGLIGWSGGWCGGFVLYGDMRRDNGG